jgi:hypothetical protein
MTTTLTPSENAILIVLMAEAREITNVELKARYGLDVKKKNRDNLTKDRLIESRKEGRSNALLLADNGWRRVRDGLDFSKSSPKALGAALTALCESLRTRVMPQTGHSNFSEMFSRANLSTQTNASGPPSHNRPVPGSGNNLDVRIRNAYAALSGEPGAWVGLARLRPFFGDVPVGDLDDALRQLERAPDVNIVPESNRKALTEKDRDAALHIGGQDKHLLAIGV